MPLNSGQIQRQRIMCRLLIYELWTPLNRGRILRSRDISYLDFLLYLFFIACVGSFVPLTAYICACFKRQLCFITVKIIV